MPDKPMPPDLNRYSYVKNSPETFTDPSGHFLEYVVIDFSNFQMSTEGAIALMAGLPHPLLPPGITEVPVSGFGACAPYVYCCEVQAGPHAGTYVCGFYGSGGGGLLSLLDNFFDDAIGWLGDQVDWLLDHLSGVDWEEAAKALLQLKDALNQVKTCVGAAAVVMEGVNVIRLGALAYASPDPATRLLGPGLIGGGLVVTWAGYEWGATSNCWPSVT